MGFNKLIFFSNERFTNLDLIKRQFIFWLNLLMGWASFKFFYFVLFSAVYFKTHPTFIFLLFLFIFLYFSFFILFIIIYSNSIHKIRWSENSFFFFTCFIYLKWQNMIKLNNTFFILIFFSFILKLFYLFGRNWVLTYMKKNIFYFD